MNTPDSTYFIEISSLHFADMPGGQLPEAAQASVDPWLARGTGVLARLHNRGQWPGSFDYVVISDDAVYFASLADDTGCGVRSFKGFRSADITAFAFFTGEGDEAPHLQLMFRDGRCVKLALEGTGPELTRRLEQLSAQNPFRR